MEMIKVRKKEGMKMKISKWIFCVVAVALSLAYQVNQGAVNAGEMAPVSKRQDARSLGDPTAPVQMLVFSSMTCSHCSVFHTDVLSKLEDEYINKGKVYMTYIDFPFDQRALAGAMLARCIPEKDYFSFLNTLFKNQSNWAFNEKAGEIIMQYASTEGLSKADVNVCLSDAQLKNKIIADRDFYQKKYDVTGTPTVALIKGDKTEVVSGASYRRVKSAIEDLLK